jgi:hypothetical protein
MLLDCSYNRYNPNDAGPRVPGYHTILDEGIFERDQIITMMDLAKVILVWFGLDQFKDEWRTTTSTAPFFTTRTLSIGLG